MQFVFRIYKDHEMKLRGETMRVRVTNGILFTITSIQLQYHRYRIRELSVS